MDISLDMKPFRIKEYQQRTLSAERLEQIYHKKWFKLFVPEAFGGLELSLKEGAQILTKAASIQGGLGWIVNLGCGANWFSGFFKSKIARELFSPSETVVAGSGFVNGTFKKQDGEILLNGSWPKCTGAAHATLFSLNAKNEAGKTQSFIVPAEKVQFSDKDWPIFGLKNTSTFSINLKNVAIPHSFGFTINEVKNHHGYAVFHIPFESFARLCMASSYIGIVECFINYAKAQWGNDNESIAREIEKTSSIIDEAKDIRNRWAGELQQLVANEELTEKHQDKIHHSFGKTNLLLFKQAQQLFLAGGLAMVEEDQLVHWAYRDVLAAAQHHFVNP